ncbi:MAG TPA: tetratricopeptide repeat protein [Myxococcales bacterium]|nr:tetratricopeptide repeat protein [Myxococcales bacterium]
MIPDSVSTSDQLACLYVDAEDWVKAETLLTMVVNRADDDVDTEWLCQLHFRLGLTLENLLRPEEALKEYETAYELDEKNLIIGKALGRLAFSTGDLERAESIYNSIVESLGDDASDDELVPLYKTLGEMALKRGDDEAARNYFEQTISLQPGNIDAIKHLLEVFAQQGYIDGMVQYTAELMDQLDDDLEKFELQVRLGDTYLKELQDVDSAIDAYQSALDYAPNSKAAYLKIFQVLADAERHEEAVPMLERMVELEDEDKRKATFCGAIGDIYRAKLFDAEQAVNWYNQALDLDPSLLKLFRAIDEMLTERKDWKALQKNYRLMLKRVEDDDTQAKLQHKLLFFLGEIYRSRLNSLANAKGAFEAALQINPTDVKSIEILGELYLADGEYEQAIEKQRALLALKPGDLTLYRSLKQIYLDAGHKDGAWVACGVLVMLQQADEEEQKYYESHVSEGMLSGTQAVEGDIWGRYLLSRQEDLLVGQIIQKIYQGLGDSLAKNTLKDLGLTKKNQIDLSERELFTHVLNSAVEVLAISPAPSVFVSEKTTGMHIAEVVPPAIVIGSDLRTGKRDQELAFVLGKVLTYFHPLHIGACIVSPETLQVLFMAALKLFVPKTDVGELENQESFQNVLEAMSEIPSQLQGSLGKWVVEFDSRGHSANLQKWLNQIELTANHAGLVMCNDVVLAAEMIKSEQSQGLFTAPSRLSNRDKLVDLAVYAMSDEYLTLREELGISVA